MSAVQMRRPTHRCWQCGKLSFHSRGDAQRFLRDRTDRPGFDGANMFAYRCRVGNGWHVGHDALKQARRDLARPQPAWMAAWRHA